MFGIDFPPYLIDFFGTNSSRRIGLIVLEQIFIEMYFPQNMLEHVCN
jgi:negative regulator of replication initiation